MRQPDIRRGYPADLLSLKFGYYFLMLQAGVPLPLHSLQHSARQCGQKW